MAQIILEAIALGLFLALFIGPSFFYLIQVGISKGFKSAAFFALGIAISDLLLLLLILKGLQAVLDSYWFQALFSGIAGTMVLYLGIQSLIKKQVNTAVSYTTPNTKNALSFLVKGVFINGTNPFTFMVWVGVMGTVGIQKSYTGTEYSLFIGSLLCTILAADLLKAYLAKLLAIRLTHEWLHKINRFIGVAFIALSLRLFYNLYTLIG